jgi:hypothetical protein
MRLHGCSGVLNGRFIVLLNNDGCAVARSTDYVESSLP